MSDTFLLTPDPPDIADLGPAEAASLAEEARGLGFAVFTLDGSGMVTKAGLMDHAAERLGFPGDFGKNWDALIDYLGDLATFHNNDKVLVLIGSPEKIGGADPSLLVQLRKVLGFACANAREWSKSKVILKFAFLQPGKTARP